MIETDPQDFDDFAALLSLIQDCFAYMEGRIDPPSSLNTMTEASLRAKAQAEHLILLRDAKGGPQACLFAAQHEDALYLGKIAVAPHLQGQGIARDLVRAAAALAKELGLPALTLQTRVELTQNHAVFAKLGFVETARTAHAGYDHPTSICFRHLL